MDNEDLLNAGMGYVAGNSMMRGIADNLRRQREEVEKRLAHITTEEVLAVEIEMELMNILIHILTRKLLMLHKIKPIIYILWKLS